jgi:dihydropteroate synthase
MVDKEVPLIQARKTLQKDVMLDPQGFFVIEIDRKREEIRVEYYSNVYKKKKIVSGILEKVIVGRKADALSDTIGKHVSGLRPEHYMYLGRELQKAQRALEQGKKYVQGGC